MGYVLKAVLSSAQHPEYGQITVPFPIPDEKYDRMIELLEPLEIGDALRQDCRVDELDSFYTVLNRLVGSLVNFDELDYLAKRLDSFDDGEAAQFQGMACKLGVSNIKDFINLTFCCQQATVITDFSDLDAIGRQHYMTMQGGGCRIEELERLDGRKFALDLILNHLEGRITPYGVVYDNGMKLEQLYDGRHFPCYHYQPNLLAVGLSSRQEPENTDQITWLLLPCSEQQLQRGIARSGVTLMDLVTEAFPIVVFAKQLEDKSRKIMEIMECEILPTGERRYNTLYHFKIEENRLEDGKYRIKGRHEAVNPISESLQKRFIDNGMPQEVLTQLVGKKSAPSKGKSGSSPAKAGQATPAPKTRSAQSKPPAKPETGKEGGESV